MKTNSNFFSICLQSKDFGIVLLHETFASQIYRCVQKETMFFVPFFSCESWVIGKRWRETFFDKDDVHLKSQNFVKKNSSPSFTDYTHDSHEKKIQRNIVSSTSQRRNVLQLKFYYFNFIVEQSQRIFISCSIDNHCP